MKGAAGLTQQRRFVFLFFLSWGGGGAIVVETVAFVSTTGGPKLSAFGGEHPTLESQIRLHESKKVGQTRPVRLVRVKIKLSPTTISTQIPGDVEENICQDLHNTGSKNKPSNPEKVPRENTAIKTTSKKHPTRQSFPLTWSPLRHRLPRAPSPDPPRAGLPQPSSTRRTRDPRGAGRGTPAAAPGSQTPPHRQPRCSP